VRSPIDRPLLRGEPLVAQTYAKMAERGRSEEAPRPQAEARRDRTAAAREGPPRAARGDPTPEDATRPEGEFLRGAGGVSVSEPPPSAGCSDARDGAEERALGAAEGEEFLRTAWRASVWLRGGGREASSSSPPPSSLVFVDEMGTNDGDQRWGPAAHSLRSTPGRGAGNGRTRRRPPSPKALWPSAVPWRSAGRARRWWSGAFVHKDQATLGSQHPSSVLARHLAPLRLARRPPAISLESSAQLAHAPAHRRAADPDAALLLPELP